MDSRTWMEQLFPIDKSTFRSNNSNESNNNNNSSIRSRLCIDDLIFPGSHNAATFSFNTNNMNIMHSGLGSLNTRLIDRLSCNSFAATDFIVGWSKNQDLNLFQQLEHGIRYLDIDVAIDCSDSLLNAGRFFTCHTFRCIELEAAFNEIIEFVKLHPLEIILVDIQINKERGTLFDFSKLSQMVESTFGQFAIPYSDRFAPLSHHYQASHSVVLFSNASEMLNLLPQMIWNAQIFYGTWIDTSNLLHKQRELENQLVSFQTQHGAKRIELKTKLSLEQQSYSSSPSPSSSTSTATASTITTTRAASSSQLVLFTTEQGNNAGRPVSGSSLDPSSFSEFPLHTLTYTLTPQNGDVVKAALQRCACCWTFGCLFFGRCWLYPPNTGKYVNSRFASTIEPSSSYITTTQPSASFSSSSSSSAFSSSPSSSSTSSSLTSYPRYVNVTKHHERSIHYDEVLPSIHDNLRYMTHRLNSTLPEFAGRHWNSLVEASNVIIGDFVEESELVDMVIQLNIERLKKKGLF